MASFASSYIPTTSATVTRAADVPSMTGTNFSDWYNASEGTFVVEADSVRSANNIGYFSAYRTSGSASDRIDARSSGGFVTSGGVDVFVPSATNPVAGAVAKTALAYRVNDFAFCRNGGSVTTDASGALPVGIDTLFLGALANGVNPLNGHLRRLTYYPTRLSNAQLQALTA